MKIEQDDLMLSKQKKTKMSTIIAVLIVITIIVVIGIIFAMLQFTEKELSVVIDGKIVNVSNDTFLFTEDGKIYVSIRDIAPLVGYDPHNGEYKIDVEDPNKMYVEAIAGTETTSFYLNSTTISKVAPNTSNDYENIVIKEPVTMNNGKMYVSHDGFVVGFNSLFGYDKDTNRITIQTLPNLVEQYSAKVTDYGYSKISEEFNNQKALIYGMIVASKDTNSKFGVISMNGTEIISPRYNEIKFVESTGEFIITNSSQKVGIAYNNGKTKITVAYDEINVIDSTLGLYLVKSNNKYGVINSSEATVLHVEFDQIGVDTSKFQSDNINNQYILYGKIIPAKSNGKWVLFNIEGKRINNNEYDELGYIVGNSKDKIGNNALTIGETKTIIVGKDKLYGGVDVKGNELIQIMFNGICSKTVSGQTSYYILFNGQEYDAEEYINAMKKALGYTDEEEQETDIDIKQNSNSNDDNNDNNDTNTTISGNSVTNEIITNQVNSDNQNNVTITNTNVVNNYNEL